MLLDVTAEIPVHLQLGGALIMPMMRPFPQVHTGLVPFSITYSYSQDFVTPPGCSNVKLVGHGSSGQQGGWSTPQLAIVRVWSNNSFPGSTVPYDGVSWDELNAWIGSYYSSYGSGNRRDVPYFSPAFFNGPEVPGNQSGIHVSLVFASANPADTDIPIAYGIASPRPMLLPNPTNYPSWLWSAATIIGDFNSQRIATTSTPGNSQGRPAAPNVLPPTGSGPITWGSLANWRFMLSTGWAATLTYEIAQPIFIFQPGMPYSFPAIAVGFDPQSGGQDATAFGRTFPGGQLIAGNGIANNPNCYGYSLPPAEMTFPTNATTPGSTHPLVVPQGAQITVSGLRFP